MAIAEPIAVVPNPRRWFHLTPGKLLVVLLAVEGGLLLSERWFPKGWAVLIAIAAVAVTMVLMLLWLAVALLFRRRFQFSIRSLMLLTVAVAVPCSWLAVKMREEHKQLYAVKHIMDTGGWIYWEDQWISKTGIAHFHGPLWLCKILGIGFFNDVTVVSYDYDSLVTDNDLKALVGLKGLRRLIIANPTLTDAALEHICCLKQLEYLSLNGTEYTDTGIIKLKDELPNCTINRTMTPNFKPFLKR